MGIHYYIEDKDRANLFDKYDIRPKIDVLLYKFIDDLRWVKEEDFDISELLRKVPHFEDVGPLEGQEAKDLIRKLQNALREELKKFNKDMEEAKRFLEIPIEEVEMFFRL